MSKFLN